MHTDSSASFTYFASASASECTTTVLMPSSRQARWIRRAISPRLAIRIFSNIRLADDEQRLTKLHRLAVFYQNSLDDPSLIRVDLVEQLHRFDNAQGIAAVHGLTNIHKCLGARRGGAVEGADHRRFHHMAFGCGGFGGFRCRRGGLRRGR